MVQKPFQTDACLPREMAQRVNEIGVSNFQDFRATSFRSIWEISSGAL